MRWSGATGAIARCKRVSTGCAHKSRFVPAWRWICGGKPKLKAGNKPSPHSIRPGLDKPGDFTTVSENGAFSSGASRSLWINCNHLQIMINCAKKVGQQYPFLREHQPLFLSNAIVHRGGEAKDLPDGKPRTVTTAVVPIRNGRCGSCSSSRTRTWNLLARRTQFSVCCTSGSTPTVAPS